MQEQKKEEQTQENTVIRDGFTKPGDKPGVGEEATKKTNRRDTPVAPGEKIEGANEDEE